MEEGVVDAAYLPIQLSLVCLGGALGGVCRYLVTTLIGARWGDDFPWGTLLVNVTGAGLLGLLGGLLWSGPGTGSGSAWALLAVGAAGSYTTVSAFSLHTLALLERGAGRQAVANVLASVLFCMLAVSLGWFLGMGLSGA